MWRKGCPRILSSTWVYDQKIKLRGLFRGGVVQVDSFSCQSASDWNPTFVFPIFFFWVYCCCFNKQKQCSWPQEHGLLPPIITFWFLVDEEISCFAICCWLLLWTFHFSRTPPCHSFSAPNSRKLSIRDSLPSASHPFAFWLGSADGRGAGDEGGQRKSPFVIAVY